jgi:tRNA uridine 5-carboxymethylaminomethyl modification enzyme
MEKFNVIVIGAGHAGCEAALACARMGQTALLVTMNLDAIAQMSCNPAIGGIAKGQMVRELDALGGEMGKVTDEAGLQFRMLNMSRGPAVWSPRAQCDKRLYSLSMKNRLESQPNLKILQAEATRIIIESGKTAGIETKTGTVINSDSVILTAGTFLKGLIHVGLTHFSGGRFGELSSETLSDSLKALGFEIKRLKTGTPPRLNGRTIDFSKMKEQPGDNPPIPFSHFTNTQEFKNKLQLACWLTYTNKTTHDIINSNLDRSPLYQGVIKGIGPRYCPSIEDKIVRFAERERHQVFLEPEGFGTHEFYANGISTSLPEDVQEKIVHSIVGLENTQIIRYGYAIEYDFFPPTQLKSTLETKAVENLYFAGQVNGTTGYEEAAAQGLMAGINCALKLKGKEPFILNRDEAYIGVMIDELITRGVDEPYRMFTARAEYRLMLRSDNADLRLMDHGHSTGLINDEQFSRFDNYRKALADRLDGKETEMKEELLFPWTKEKIDFEVEVDKKYAPYILRQKEVIEKTGKLENKRLPENVNYDSMTGLLTEAKQRLNRVRPATIGQASRIPGVTPADIAVVLINLAKEKAGK